MNKNGVLIFIGIIVVGLIISLLTLSECGTVVEVEDEEKAPIESAETPTSEADAPPEAPEKTPSPKEGTFPSPAAAMSALAETAAAKDFDKFVSVVGPDAIEASQSDRVKNLIESEALSVDPETPYSEVSKSATTVRWSLNFADESAEAETPLFADLEDEGENEFVFSRISLPLELPSTTEAKADDAPETTAEPKPEPEAESTPDALSVAQAFATAVVKRDFQSARSLSDTKSVTDERVAALMIAIEEGGFALKKERPFVVTLSREDITWVLTRVQSSSQDSEFAIELGQFSDQWLVNGLTFSKVLSALADQSGAGGVAYSPIVEDPAGGDSLVLYFDFDTAETTARAEKQLAIIADILSQDPNRVIRINGHADALGTDSYNKALSNSRAEAIRKVLIEYGVAPAQIVTDAFGESKPRRPNFKPDGSDNPTGRSANRRAEVYLDF